MTGRIYTTYSFHSSCNHTEKKCDWEYNRLATNERRASLRPKMLFAQVPPGQEMVMNWQGQCTSFPGAPSSREWSNSKQNRTFLSQRKADIFHSSQGWVRSISSSVWLLFFSLIVSRKPGFGVSPFSSYSIEAPIKASRRALRLFIQPIASCRPDVDKEVNEVFHLYIATISVFLSEKWPLPSVLRLNCIPRKLLLQIPLERVRIIRLCPTSPQGSRSQVDQLLVHISRISPH